MERKPLNNKHKKKKSKLPLRILIVTILLSIIICLVGAIMFAAEGDKDINVVESTVIFDDNNNIITTIHGEENRTIVSLNEIPKNLQNAFIAIEDNRFYDHFGIDIIGIGRAIVKNIASGGVSEGGSTITQQLAKNKFLTQEQTFSRKIKEIGIALKLESKYSKDEILEMYLNQIYFGRGAYGVETASRIYFGKDVKDLTLSECAMLAGIPRSPNYYSPANNLDASIKRRNEVLNQMVKYGYITEAEKNKAINEKPNIVTSNEEKYETVAKYFIDYVLQEVIDKYGADAVYKNGLRIYTTLDLKMQKEAEKALVENLPTYYTNENGILEPQGAIVSIDPKNGYIKAMVGGRGSDDFNRATLAIRQPGSAFKPFTYIAILEKYHNPNMTFSNMPLNINGWQPQNYSRNFSEMESMRTAAIHSLNLPTIRMAQDVGMEKVLDIARNMGISTIDANDNNLAAAIGGMTRGVTVLDMAIAYGVLANEGIKTTPIAITKIEDRYGKILFEAKQQKTEVLSRNIANQMSSILQDAVSFGTGAGANIGRPVAGKTGTTDNYQDAWFAGYTPNMVTVVWVGTDDNRRMANITGGSIPAKIWRDYMKNALKTPPSNFPIPGSSYLEKKSEEAAENEGDNPQNLDAENEDLPQAKESTPKPVKDIKTSSNDIEYVPTSMKGAN